MGKSFDEKLHEYIMDITQERVISHCCGAKVYLDFCGECKEHCSAVYENLECEKCGGLIDAMNYCCIDCGMKYK